MSFNSISLRRRPFLWMGFGFAVLLLLFGWTVACKSGTAPAPQANVAAGGDANAVIAERGLTPDDVYAAVKTYQPSGRLDDYVLFSSGGHSGQVLVIGVPSMRLLKVLAVFTPEPWQGFGFSGETKAVLKEGEVDGKKINWADTHHPALSETAGDYDGQFLFIGDKAHGRVGVVDLRDFETKQIVKNPIALSTHGAAFVTPNTDYIIEGGQYAAPIGWAYAKIEDYQKEYRGSVTMWKFDRAKGRLVPEESFTIELPPYWQDLCDSGKLVSDGWFFCNSFNSEMATGGNMQGQPQFESGVSQRDVDYLHVVNWKKAVELVQAGKAKTIKGFKMLPLEVAAKEGVLYFVPEPKSPHGVDVTPGGEYMVVGGKLDPHVTVYSFAKLKAAIEAGKFSGQDPYGVNIVNFDDALESQVELGLGPLHTVYDDKGYAYTSMFLDSAVARWTLGGPYAGKNPDAPWTLVQKLPMHYNIGHIAAAEGDTVSPDGKYVVGLDKWSVDRFVNVGPLHPQNFQLVDIGGNSQGMKLLYDMPIGIGEPHYAQMIKADKLKGWDVYPEVGFNPDTMAKHKDAVEAGQERVVRNGKNVEIWMTAVRSHFTPDRVELKQGDRVTWHITNIDRAKDATHGLAIPAWDINLSLEPGETSTVQFTADQPGTYTYYCSEFCSALHLEMVGYFLVSPAS